LPESRPKPRQPSAPPPRRPISAAASPWIKIRYWSAYEHARQAARLAPENGLYLAGAGEFAQILGDYRAAKDYYEQALASGLNAYGGDHPLILLPELLGDERRFRRLFCTPIERYGDEHRQEQLRWRAAPFFLRRTKEAVVTELPAKTEILRQVPLVNNQCDLYETLRLAMDERVRQEVARKGLARSGIIILDALLKLRQVCCDPRLVALESARKVKGSAKLELLRRRSRTAACARTRTS